MKNRSLLDREKKSKYDLLIKASNKNASVFSTVPCHITIRDVNDNRPEFLQREYKFYIAEKDSNLVDSLMIASSSGSKNVDEISRFTSAGMTHVGSVRAFDRDASSDLFYYLDLTSEAYIELNTAPIKPPNARELYSINNNSSLSSASRQQHFGELSAVYDLDDLEFSDSTIYEVTAIRQNVDLGNNDADGFNEYVFNFTDEDSIVGKHKKVQQLEEVS